MLKIRFSDRMGEIFKDIKTNELVIGDDCWIGYGVIITSSCHNIGNGAVIGVGTILTRDLEPYSVAVGNSGRKIRSRFNNETIELLEQSKWFDLEPTEFLKFYNWINSPKEFAIKIMNANNSR